MPERWWTLREARVSRATVERAGVSDASAPPDGGREVSTAYMDLARHDHGQHVLSLGLETKAPGGDIVRVEVLGLLDLLRGQKGEDGETTVPESSTPDAVDEAMLLVWPYLRTAFIDGARLVGQLPEPPFEAPTHAQLDDFRIREANESDVSDVSGDL